MRQLIFMIGFLTIFLAGVAFSVGQLVAHFV